MRIITKDEFKKSMMDAKIREEIEREEDPAPITDKPKRGRPRKYSEPEKETKPKKSTSKKPETINPKKEPVAAGRFSDKEREALQCLTQIAENHTADVIQKATDLMTQADKLTNISILYREYIDTVKEMIK